MIAKKYYNLRTDLQNGIGLEEALIKNQTNLKEAFEKLKHKKQPRPKKKKLQEPYIQYRQGKYYVRKAKKAQRNKEKRWVNVMFGTYHTLEDAKRMREALKEDGWHQTHVDEICERLGITRAENPHYTHKVRYH